MGKPETTSVINAKLKVSVTALADFSCRIGDLELNGTIGPTAKQGMRTHKQVQSERSVDSEARMSTAIDIKGVLVTLGGRVDLLDTTAHRLSEIKTTLVPADRLSPSKLALQWAQIKLYGFCYCQLLKEQGASLPDKGLELELIHVNIRAENQSSHVQVLSEQTLNLFAISALEKYVAWNKLVWGMQEQTRESAGKLEFPYKNFRAGQRDMAAAVFRSARDGESLLCEAPTGTGKTLSSLFPVVKALGEGYVKHAVYLTAKTSGRQSVMQSFRMLENAGLKMSSVIIRSKSPTCFCSNGRCERDDKNVCPMTVGFFDRLPDARKEAISKGVLDGDQLDEIAWAHQICPFELGLQLLPWVSIAVADFNYVFDPLVRIARFSESRRDTALLIDEAHNLVDRARGMHSGHLNRTDLIAAQKLLGANHALLSSRIKSLSKGLSQFASKQEHPTSVGDEVPKKLVKQSSAVVESYMEALDRGPALPESLFDVFKMACRFIAISELYGDQHKVVVNVEKTARTNNVSVNLKCLDAAHYLTPQYNLFRSTVVFSATLRPAPYYRDALGLVERTQQLVLGSPFTSDQAKHCVVGYINTRYQYRSDSTPQLLELLNVMVSAKSGNYMVFFPSYAYLELVHNAFIRQHPKTETWVQPRHTDVEDREALLARLELRGTRLGFAIMGGLFGEGIDYVGDKLIGVVLVGVGLPGIGVEQDLIASCYREQGLDGFDYAYRYPGFTKVLQSAGRVIRSESDRGVIFLVDDRFGQPFYRNLYPPHWQVESSQSLAGIEDSLNVFWSSQERLALS